MYSLNNLYPAIVYKHFANNISDSDFEKKIQVLVYTGASWLDITSEVYQIEIEHSMQIEGNSGADRISIELYNELGQFDPAKVTDSFDVNQKKFNPLVGSQPFLTTNFPIVVNLIYKYNNLTQTITLFRGYNYKITSKGTKATLRALDILFHFSRKRLSTGVLVPNQKVDKAFWYLLKAGLDEIATIFGLGSIPIYINGVQYNGTNDVTALNTIINIEGGKSYLETLNKLLNQLQGFMMYIPQLNQLQIILPADDTYATYLNTLTTNYLLQDSQYFNDFEIDTSEDTPTQIKVTTDLLEAYPSEVEKYWSFVSDKPEKSIQIPANSISEIDINFQAMGFPSKIDENGNIICDELTLGKYFIDKRTTGEIGYITAPADAVPLTYKRIYLNSEGWWLTDKLKVKEAQLKLDGVKLIVQNYSQTENFYIASLKITAIPLFGTGSIVHIWDNGKTPKKEIELKSAYLVDSSTFRTIADRIVKTYNYINSFYTLSVELTEYRPDIFVGGLIMLSLPDTSINNSKAIVKRVYHLIESEKFQTRLELALVSNITYTYSQMQAYNVPSLSSYLPIIGTNNIVLV